MHAILNKLVKILIPKVIRQVLGSKTAASLNVAHTDRHRFLKVDKAFIQSKGNLVVFTGKSLGDLESSLKYIRDQRSNYSRG